MDLSLPFILLTVVLTLLGIFTGYLVSTYRTSNFFKEMSGVLEKSHPAHLSFPDQPLQPAVNAVTFLKAFNQWVNWLNKEYQSLVAANDQMIISNRIMEYSKHKFQGILNATPDGILVMDLLGNVILVNRAAENHLEIDAKEIVGKPLHEGLVSPYLRQLAEGTEKYVDIQKEGVQADKFLRISLQPIRHANSQLTDSHSIDAHSGKVMIIRDISGQVMADQARGEFIAHIAHELKTPLNTLKSYSEMLMDGEAGDEETKREFYNTINEEADRLSGLIGNLLNITKIELGSLQISKSRLKTGEFLEELYHLLDRYKKGKHLSINLVLPDKLPNIQADKELLKVALLNLLSNAIKYTGEGKGVTLKAEEEDDVILIHVIDSGIGIPLKDLPHIFEKFYRSEDKSVRQQPGHGLGLALARQIVQLHGGEIRVISHPGEGSQFTVILNKEEDILV